jgi:hypothetical protein
VRNKVVEIWTEMKGRDGVRNEHDIWCMTVLASTFAFPVLRLKDVRRDDSYANVAGMESRRQTHLQDVKSYASRNLFIYAVPRKPTNLKWKYKVGMSKVLSPTCAPQCFSKTHPHVLKQPIIALSNEASAKSPQ